MRFNILAALRAAFWPIDDDSNRRLIAAIDDDETASATLDFESRRAGLLAQTGEDLRGHPLDRAVELLVEGKGR